MSFRDDYWAKEEKKQINKWLDVPAPIHEDLRKVVNEKLLAEGIPEVEDDVIYWRMIQLTRLACAFRVERNLRPRLTIHSVKSQRTAS